VIEHFVSSGCSFTERPGNWHTLIHEKLGSSIRHYPLGMSSQGNGLISRRLIHQCQGLLQQGHAADTIFAAVMWSGPDRHDYYTRSNPGFLGNMHGWSRNPVQFTDSGEGAWVIFNPQWEMQNCQTWYQHFHDDVGAVIATLEHMLRTQWYLKTAGIPYIMSTYMTTVLPDWCCTHPDTQHLWNMLDHDSFVPVLGMWEWCKEHTDIEFRPGDYHPTLDHHEAFVEQVMWPFVKERI
jgi:hypothetical protein